MPQLNFTLVKKNLKRDIIDSAIEGIDVQFQADIEAELRTAREPDGSLNMSLAGEKLTALSKTISDICLTYNNLTFTDIPSSIVALLQEMINTHSPFTSRLEWVYFTTQRLDWEPQYTGTSKFADLEVEDDEDFDDEFDAVVYNVTAPTINTADDDFVHVSGPTPVNAQLKPVILDNAVVDTVTAPTINTADNYFVHASESTTVNAHLKPLVLDDVVPSDAMTDSLSSSLSSPLASYDGSLSLSTSSLANSSHLEELRQQLSQNEKDLQASTEALSKSQIEYQQLHNKETTSTIQKLLATKILNRLNNKTTAKIKTPCVRKEREAETLDSFIALSTLFNQRIYKSNDIIELQKKQSQLETAQKKLGYQLTSMSSPASFFAPQQKQLSHPSNTDLNQSMVLLEINSTNSNHRSPDLLHP
jgi:hypothetical protein